MKDIWSIEDPKDAKAPSKASKDHPIHSWYRVAAQDGSTVIYFDCAGCKAKAPEIAGFIGTGPEIHQIAVLKGGPPYKLAMYCSPCFELKLGGLER